MFQQIDQLNTDIWENATNDPAAALKKAQEALKMSQSGEYQLGIAESLLNIGRCSIFTADYSNARNTINQALERFRTISGKRAETGELRALNALGVASYETQDYESALNYYFMVLTQTDASSNDEIKIMALNNIGEVHSLLNNIEEALSYDHQALQLAEQTDSKFSRAITMFNLGELYLKLNDLFEAGEYFKKTLELSEQISNTQLKADALCGIGRIQLLKEEYFGAEDKLRTAFELYEKICDKPAAAECNYQFGLIGLSNKKYEEAGKYFEKALDTAEELGLSELLSRCMLKLSDIAKEGENFREALEFYKRHHDLEEELKNDGLRNRLKKITILYETEQTETEKEAYRLQSLELEKSNREIRFINELGQEVTSSLHLDDIIHNTYNRLAELIDITSFGIALYDKDSNEVEYSYIVENSERHTPLSIPADSETSLTVWCLKNRKPVLIKTRKDSDKYISFWKSGTEVRSNSAIYMPMLHGSKLVGCMTIQHAEENRYSESDLDIVGAVSTFLAIAVDNSQTHTELNKLNEIITSEKKGLEVAYRKIAHMANHDALTDLPNRHLLHELLSRGIKIAAREKQKMAVLYMDLDNFKPINDTLGHESGDIVLTAVAERLNKVLRNSDTVARIGGDEFVAVLYNIDSEEGIKSAASKVIQIIGEEIKLKGRTFKIGVSIGVSIYPDNDTTLDGLLLKADKAMYKAKQTGRNKAVFYK